MKSLKIKSKPRRKTSFPIKQVENADLYKPVLKKNNDDKRMKRLTLSVITNNPFPIFRIPE